MTKAVQTSVLHNFAHRYNMIFPIVEYSVLTLMEYGNVYSPPAEKYFHQPH